MTHALRLAILCLVASGAWAQGADAPALPGAGDAALAALAQEYLDQWYLPAQPTVATHLGIHTYDDALEDYSRAGIKRQIEALSGYERRLDALNPAALSEQGQGDRDLLRSDVGSRLLSLRTIREWEKDPDLYASGITDAAYVIMQRDYAPAAERLGHVVAREALMPAVLREARQNLKNPPRIFTQIAIEQIPGDIRLFERDLPLAFQSVTDPVLRARFTRSNRAVIEALRQYQHWLSQSLLPRSHGDFRLGAAVFARKLALDEMVDTPLDRLLKLGMDDLHRNQQAFARVAQDFEPGKSTPQVLADVQRAYPPPAELLQRFRDSFDGIIDFIQTHHLITLPSPVRPILQETPPFMRATTFASMDTPGPFEQHSEQAYFNVTLPDPAWSAERTEGFMAEFNDGLISNIAVHEAYPGHYVQFLWLHRQSDPVRRVFGASTNTEGWAHYCEQMVLDEGYGQPGAGARDAHEAARLKLGQLQDALLRDARFIVALQMHTGKMSLDQARAFFVHQGYQSPETADMEAKRGAGNPMYLYYTLGKLQILKLRADLAAREGADFDLQRFHDRFMAQGLAPIRLVRRSLLHDDSPTL